MGKAKLGMMIKECVILHNMINVDEREAYDLAYDMMIWRTTPSSLMSGETIICGMQPTFIE